MARKKKRARRIAKKTLVRRKRARLKNPRRKLAASTAHIVVLNPVSQEVWYYFGGMEFKDSKRDGKRRAFVYDTQSAAYRDAQTLLPKIHATFPKRKGYQVGAIPTNFSKKETLEKYRGK